MTSMFDPFRQAAIQSATRMKELPDDRPIDSLDELRKLCGISSPSSMNSVAMYSTSDKNRYAKEFNVVSGTPEWFRLWYAKPELTGENPCPKWK